VYLIRQPPYRTGNRPMASPSELLLVPGSPRNLWLPGGIDHHPAGAGADLAERQHRLPRPWQPLRPADPRQVEQLVKERPARRLQGTWQLFWPVHPWREAA